MSLASYTSTHGATSRESINLLARAVRSRSKGAGLNMKTTPGLGAQTPEHDEFAIGDHSIAG